MKYKTFKNGFALAEIMIIVTIIGLLSAIAIPAFQKVKYESIRKAIEEKHEIVSDSQYTYYLEYRKDNDIEDTKKKQAEKQSVQVQQQVKNEIPLSEASLRDFRRITIDGKQYILIPER